MSVSVGCRLISAPDEAQGAEIPLVLLYPTAASPREERFGPYAFDVAMDAELSGPLAGLVVLSHGGGGSPWTLRDLAAALVRAGFLVCLPEHMGDSRSDGRLTGTAANLENRPRHVSLAIDAILADPSLGPALQGRRVAVGGMSIGGYTALAAAGGRPHSGPLESDGPPRPIAVKKDERVAAVVLLAPAVVWFWREDALADVTVPILMRTGGKDEVTPAVHTDLVLRRLPAGTPMDHQVVEDAGHFAFLSPFPPAMTRPDIPPSQDPPGFDRRAYQPRLHTEVLEFLRRSL